MTPSESRALMQRELDEQADILLAAAEPLSREARRLRPRKTGTIWIGGCGDSLFAAQALTRHFRRRGWDMRPASAAEMLWEADIRPDDTVVGISISGSTRRTVEALSRAGGRGANTLAVTLNAESALAQAARASLILPFRPISRAIPHGLDYHVTLLALAALAGDVPTGRIVDLFRSATASRLDDARSLAGGLGPEARFFFLGSGSALGSANYGAAKLQEAGGLPAWAFEAENFAHGAQYMLRPTDHVVLYGAAGPGDLRAGTLRPGLDRLVASVGGAALIGESADPDASLLAAHDCALHAQAFCLAVSERLDLDVTDPGRGSGAAEVQREWFGWTSG